MCALVCCRLGTRALHFLFQNTSGLGAGIRMGRLGRKGPELPKS